MLVKTYNRFGEVERIARVSKGRWLFVLVTGIVLILASLLAAIPMFSSLPKIPNPIDIGSDVAMPAVVMVDISGRTGSGFFVSSELILTSASVGQSNGEQATVTNENGQSFTGEVVATGYAEWVRASGVSSIENDFAVVKVPASYELTPLPYGTASSVMPKGALVAVAFAGGGKVTAKQLTAVRVDGSAIILDLSPDQSFLGGPVLQVNPGEKLTSAAVVGMVASPADGISGNGSAVAIDVVRDKCNTLGFSF